MIQAPQVIEKRSLFPADQALRKAIYQFNTDGKTVQLPRTAFGLAREIIGRKIYDWDKRFSIQPGNQVIDLGANVGVFSLVAAAAGAQVIAIEAQSEMVVELQHALRLNQIDTVNPIHGIVAPETGLLASLEARGLASHWKTEPPKVDMNQLLSNSKWSYVDFLKVDVEGAEFELFMTNDDWLSKVRRIAMEVHSEYGSVDDLILHLQSKGFETNLADLDKRPVEKLPGKMGFIYAIKQ